SIDRTLGTRLWELQQIAEQRGEALQLGLVIGVHPAIALGALAIGSIDEDERAIMGALLGEPLELVKCQTSDVLEPAHAEMVLECEILPGKRTAEGPFGEFTGYSLGERQREVVKVKAITHRRDAMFQDITVAHLDHMLLSTIPMEANLYRAVRAMVPSVRAVRVPAPFTCYVAIEQRLVGQAKNAIMAVFGADLYMKRVVVVDHDVDVFDDRQISWALATRCQPDRDITLVTHARGSDLDPSTREGGYTAKWGVDATAKPSPGAYTPRPRVPPDDRAAVGMPNLGQFCGALLVGLKAGLTLAAIVPLLKAEERAEIVADLKPALVLYELTTVEAAEWTTREATLAPALVLYTSGSTGRPKGALLSHTAVEVAERSWAGPVMALTADDVVLAAL